MWQKQRPGLVASLVTRLIIIAWIAVVVQHIGVHILLFAGVASALFAGCVVLVQGDRGRSYTGLGLSVLATVISCWFLLALRGEGIGDLMLWGEICILSIGVALVALYPSGYLRRLHQAE